MNLLNVFDHLAYGELSQVFDGVPPQNLEPDHRRKLVHHVQVGLTTLYKRFLLKEGRLTLVPVDGRLIYPLSSQYAESNTASTETDKYIKDSGNPFQDDLIKVARVYNQDDWELWLNDLDNPASLHTPDARTLVLPKDHTHVELTVVYHANHVDVRDLASYQELHDIPVHLPDTHLEALGYFVASRVLNPVGISGEFHEGNNYTSKYEMACRALEHQGQQVDQISSHTLFEERGFR